MANCNKSVVLGLILVAALVAVGYSLNKKSKKENFTYDQLLLNAKNYTFIPSEDCQGCLPQARPNMTSLTCRSSNLPKELQGMTPEQIKAEVDLHYRKPLELVPAKDLLPETDLSGLSYGTDPAEDFANKFVWHRTTTARLKRRNWEGGSSMIRGDLIIDPGQNTGWFHTDMDFRDLTPGFIPKQYCGQVDVEDLTYQMNKIH